jgi:O-antigen ligase
MAGDLSAAAYVGELARRVALAMTAALITARAFWPSEPDLKEGAGAGLSWVLLVLLAAGIAVAGSLIGGRFRVRWSLADALFVVLIVVVAASAGHALDRRPAINLAWEWAGLAIVYLLVRSLPRTRGESTALAGALVATAFAASVYGLYQVAFELPLIQEAFRRNPNQMLAKLNIEPGSPSALVFANRLMASNEPWSTFALANSLAGFIAGPLVVAVGVGIVNLVRRDEAESRWGSLGMAMPVALVLLICLLLTKSRSAYLGTLAGIGVLAWRARAQVTARAFVVVGVGGLLLLGVLVLAGLRTGRLDPQVLTESSKSLRYRSEYWRGTWAMITDDAPNFWAGVGPGNFGAQYLKHKVPESSEEILDPHNLFLEVWATGGVWAVLALVGALGWGLWNLLGPPGRPIAASSPGRTANMTSRGASDVAVPNGPTPPSLFDEPDGPPKRLSWLVYSAGLGGWVIVVALGRLNPFLGDLFFRWLILGASWLVAVLLGAPLWRRQPIPAAVLGAGVLAVMIDLVAAGGIGIPTVALALWSLLALGLNLREDRPCGRLREYPTRIPAFVLAVGWAAVLGTFVGLVAPFWRAEAAIADAESALARRPADLDIADQAYRRAIEADQYFVRPWHDLALLHFRVWQERGARVDNEGSLWDRESFLYLYRMAAYPPRSPDAWAIHGERARVVERMVELVGTRLKPLEVIKYRGEIVAATRKASLLYPNNAELRARLAQANAEISMFGDAAKEGNEALRLDDVMRERHPIKALPAPVRERLLALIPKWSEAAAKAPIQIAP